MSQIPNQDKLLKTPSPSFSVDKVNEIANELYGISGTLSQLGSERDQNFHLVTATGDQFVIKIANSSEDTAIIDMQLKAMEYISKVDPDLPVPKVLLSKSGSAIEEVEAEDGRKHAVRVLSYLPGVSPRNDYVSNLLFRQMGLILARMTRALRGFFHPIANYELMWDLKHTAKLRDYLAFITNAEHHELVSYFLDRFDRNVFPEIPKLRAQIVHNDLVPDNILVAKDDPNQIIGIIDFGDLTHTLQVIDLATTIAATLNETTDPVAVAAQIVAGYNELIPLEEAELRLLYDLVGARLTMLNVIASWRVTIHPDNRNYIMGGVEQTWRILEMWRDRDPAMVAKKFLRVCGFWEHKAVKQRKDQSGKEIDSLLSRRERLLGPCAYLFYNRPLHIVRGEGVWLYDDEGNRYLDVYNNVPQVGHCHPHVVNAISNQARQLNTSTRYLHDHILDLAERITKRLPEPLSVCMFVCTGSEANELAWRMAQLASGNSGCLITNYSYHGSTAATAQFSTESLPEGKLPPHVQTFFAPTSDSNWRKPDSGIRDAIMALDEKGHRPAMLLLDTSFVSDGIYTSPNGYLKILFKETRATGGLCVADEVQGGFGRFGEHFWGFEFDDVIPDIVTMGKPMGNGHPLAAVVTRPEIAEVLANETGYFNTFGGNPVSCAAGLAVLDVIEKEGLQQNAHEVGQYLKEGLGELQKSYPQLGQVHGSGLLLGLDINTPKGKPDPEIADKIMNHMRQNGVLVGITGQKSSVLKIRPPLVFEKEHADILLAVLKKALEES
jgi:4-aminobutyrate aminotransferase-like enzyme/Ser/Thr protein kinase RdoA (MazF antagonist)